MKTPLDPIAKLFRDADLRRSSSGPIGGIAMAACLSELSASATEIQLFPAGKFRALDGRPGAGQHWEIDATIAAQMIAEAKQRANDYMVDYDHQSLQAATSGAPAPAAAWFRDLEWREGKGLFATGVRYTDRAKAMVAAGEYRYASPVFLFDVATGRVQRLISAAITNTAAIDGMQPLLERAAAAYQLHLEEHPVKREDLIKLLGLAADATEEQINSALGTAVAAAKRVPELEGAVAAAKQQLPDPAKFVPIDVVAQLQTQMAALSQKIVGSEVDTKVDAAIAAGKLMPAMRPWAVDLGKKDIAALSAYIEQAPAIAALAGSQTGGKAPADDPKGEALSETDLAVCRQLNLSPEAYRKTQLAAV